MSVIIRLQNLPLTANSIDIRNFFRGLSIPDGGVHIVGGSEGDAFIAFSTDEDARQAMQLTGQKLKDSSVKLLLSSRNEMYKVIEQARLQALGIHPQGSPLSGQGGENSTSSQSSSASSNTNQTSGNGGVGVIPPMRSPDHSNSNLANQSSLNPMLLNSGNNNSGLPISSGQSVGSNNMSSFPSPNMNLPSGLTPNHFMQGLMPNFPGMPTGPPPNPQQQMQQQQQQQFPNLSSNSQGMFNNRVPNPSINPFVMPPNMPPMGNPMGFGGMMPNSGNNISNANIPVPGNMGMQGNMNNTTGLLGMPGMMNQQQPANAGIPGTFNIGGPRLGAMNSPGGMNSNNGMNGPGGSNNSFMGMGVNNFPPNFMGNSGSNNNSGPPSGGLGPGNRPPRPNFNPHQQNQHRPTGPVNNNNANNSPHNNQRERNTAMNVPGGNMGAQNRDGGGGPLNQNRDNRDIRDRSVRRSRSRSKERRERENIAARRRRSRSRSRDGDRNRDNKDRDRRRRRSSRSRSRSRDRGVRAGRRNSRDREKGIRDERRKSESSPEKGPSSISDKLGSIKRGQENDKRGRRDSDPVANSSNITDEEHPCIKLIGLPKDASNREIREFVRVDIQGGGEGIVRQYDEGLAFLKLERAADFPKVYRSNGRKLRNCVINVEGISFDKWAHEYKCSKKGEGTRDRDRDADRDREREFRDRDRHDREKNSNPRTSRFNSTVNTSQSSCIAIRCLPPTITGKDVSSRLLRDAPVNDLLVIPVLGTNGRPTITAFVNLESSIAAQRAVDSIVRSQEGASLVVELCELEDMNQAKRSLAGASQSRDRDNRLPAGSGAKSLFDLDIGMDVESSSVMLQGVPPNITDRDVFDFFSDIGLKPTNVRKLFDHNNGSPNGQIVCEFQDNHKALRATTKDGMMFGRNTITVSLIPSNGGDKLNFRNPHGGLSRPSLLGVRPNGPGNASQQNPRFHNPAPNPNPNPFIQAAMQQSMIPNQISAAALRSNGPTRGMRNPNSRMSRFDSRPANNMEFDDFRDGSGTRNGVDRDDRVSSTTRGKGHNDVAMPQEKQLAVFKPGIASGCIVGLTNVPFKADIEDIAKFLEGILKIQIPYDRIVRNLNDMGRSTGNARIAFQTPFEAELANDRLRGAVMWNRPIVTEVVSDCVW